MTTYLRQYAPDEVIDPESFAAYAQQCIGTPHITKDMPAIRRQLKLFFAKNPQATYGTLVRTVDWCRAKKRRPATAMGVISQVRFAWSDGILPELNPHQVTADPGVEYGITMALRTETDTRWRTRLIGASGPDNRRLALVEWHHVRDL